MTYKKLKHWRSRDKLTLSIDLLAQRGSQMQSATLSRRNFFQGAFAVSSLEVRKQKKPHRTGSVELIGSADERFELIAKRSFPGITTCPNYLRLKPFMVLLRNQGTVSARAYSVQWSILDSESGDSRTVVNRVVHKHRTPRSKARVLRPQTVRLMSPYFSLCTSDYYSRGDALMGSAPASCVLKGSETSTASIDAVIFSNGTATGPDQTGLIKRYTAERNAEHDEAFSAHRHLQLSGESASISDIDQLLLSHFNAWRAKVGDDPKSLYLHARSQEAFNLHLKLLKHGIPSFRASIGRSLKFRKARVKLRHI